MGSYVAKNMNIKVFGLMSRTNETRHISWYDTCTCKCRLDASVWSNKQRWNNDKCGCECKELICKGRCNEGFIWNPSICECECDKSCNVGEYLDYENCKCRKRLINNLVEECNEDEILIKIKITCKNNCLIYINLLTVMCLILLAIAFIRCYNYYTGYRLKKEEYAMQYYINK